MLEQLLNHNMEGYILQQIEYQNGHITFFAIHEASQTSTAFKMFPSDHLIYADAQDFVEVCRHLQTLQMAPVIPIQNVGIYENWVWLARPWLDGINLQKLLQSNHSFDISYILKIIQNIVIILESLFQQEWHHGNIKPSNIWLSEQGDVQFTDLGLGGNLFNLSNQSSGINPCYIAPEQIQNPDDCDIRTDLYAVGIIMYEMLTGNPPYQGVYQKILDDHCQAAIPILPNPQHTIPDILQEWINKLLNKSPRHRFATPGIFLQEIQKFLNNLTSNNEKLSATNSPRMSPTIGLRKPTGKIPAVILSSCEAEQMQVATEAGNATKNKFKIKRENKTKVRLPTTSSSKTKPREEVQLDPEKELPFAPVQFEPLPGLEETIQPDQLPASPLNGNELESCCEAISYPSIQANNIPIASSNNVEMGIYPPPLPQPTEMPFSKNLSSYIPPIPPIPFTESSQDYAEYPDEHVDTQQNAIQRNTMESVPTRIWQLVPGVTADTLLNPMIPPNIIQPSITNHTIPPIAQPSIHTIPPHHSYCSPLIEQESSQPEDSAAPLIDTRKISLDVKAKQTIGKTLVVVGVKQKPKEHRPAWVTALVVLLILSSLCTIGGFIWFVYTNSQNIAPKNNNPITNPPQNTSSQQPIPHTQPTINPPVTNTPTFPRATPEIPSPSTSTGWFGEEMPSGMQRTSTLGAYIWQKDNSRMSYIPGGIFYCGDKKQRISVESFYIDRYELTNEQYIQFVQATKGTMPCYITQKEFGNSKHPVVGITWYEAKQYAQWVGKRLPSSTEWEKAARGGLQIPNWKAKAAPISMMDNSLSSRIYPWGNSTIISHNYQIGNCAGDQDQYAGISFVGAFPKGVSPYHCYDMVGNVWEWCDDNYKVSTPGTNSASNLKVCRGGSWRSPPEQISILRQFGVEANKKADHIGARFVK